MTMKQSHDPFIIAKIERSGARNNKAGILRAADGIMIARGDLGVEIPIEQIAVAQKKIMRQANMLGFNDAFHIVAMTLIFLSSSLGLLDYNLIWVPPTYLWPGIVGGLVMGLERTTAAEFSFFLAMPTMAAAFFRFAAMSVFLHHAPEGNGVAVGVRLELDLDL